MCVQCDTGISHECRKTGAFEMGRTPDNQIIIPQPQRMRTMTPAYLNTRAIFAQLPPNADGPRRTEDMNNRDYVHRDNIPESPASTYGFHVIDEVEVKLNK